MDVERARGVPGHAAGREAGGLQHGGRVAGETGGRNASKGSDGGARQGTGP
jgi:hypothetical protein